MVYKIKNPEKIETQINEILEAFKSGKIVETISLSFLEQVNIPSDKWSFMNKLLQFYANTKDGRTMKDWNRVGRKVTKGTKAFYIVAPLMVTKWEQDEDTKKWFSYQVHIGYYPSPHYRYEDTEGKEIKYIVKGKNLPTFKQIADKFGVKVGYDRSIVGEYGSYNRNNNTIRLSSDEPTVFLHELAHHIHNEILKEKGSKLKGGQQIGQEIVAEFSSLLLSRILGFQKSKETYQKEMGFTLKYIKSYLRTNNNENVTRAISLLLFEVEEIVKRVMSQVPEATHKEVLQVKSK